jgi:hypothetical protein
MLSNMKDFPSRHRPVKSQMVEGALHMVGHAFTGMGPQTLNSPFWAAGSFNLAANRL